MTFLKDPDSTLDYTIDWSEWLGEDTISSSSWVLPEGVSQFATANTETTATIWLSGGEVGRKYAVTNRITTAAGRTEDRTFTLLVVER